MPHRAIAWILLAMGTLAATAPCQVNAQPNARQAAASIALEYLEERLTELSDPVKRRELVDLRKQASDVGKTKEWDDAWRSFPFACSCLAGLALTSAGEVPGEGRRGALLAEVLDFLDAGLGSGHRDQWSGLVEQGGAGSWIRSSASSQGVYEYAYAVTLAAQVGAFGEGRQRLGTLCSQLQDQQQSGGWTYSGDVGDSSVTGTVLVAILAAQAAGAHIPEKQLGSAKTFLMNSRKPPRVFVMYRNDNDDHRTSADQGRAAAVMLAIQLLDGTTEPFEWDAHTAYVREQGSEVAYAAYREFYLGQLLLLKGSLRKHDELCAAAAASLSKAVQKPTTPKESTQATAGVWVAAMRVCLLNRYCVAPTLREESHGDSTRLTLVGTGDPSDAARLAAGGFMRIHVLCSPRAPASKGAGVRYTFGPAWVVSDLAPPVAHLATIELNGATGPLSLPNGLGSATYTKGPSPFGGQRAGWTFDFVTRALENVLAERCGNEALGEERSIQLVIEMKEEGSDSFLLKSGVVRIGRDPPVGAGK